MGDAIRIYDSVDMNVVMGNGGTLHHSSKVRIQEVSSLYGMKLLSIQLILKMVQLGINLFFLAVDTVMFMNLGMYGAKSCAPIIRDPWAIAVTLGAVENRVVPNEVGGDDDDGELYETKSNVDNYS